MFDEMKFLFEMDNYISNEYGDIQSVDVRYNQNEDDTFGINNYVITQGDVKNYISSSVNAPYDATSKNPYIQLLKDFNGEGSDSNMSKSLKLKPTDFSYLRDIGVYPLNRLIILRRFPEGAVVRKDLSKMNVEPISVIVGWVKSDSDEILNFSFNENWRTQNKDEMLHLLINQMMSKEFGIGLDSIAPVPGWLAGSLFGILKTIGLVSPDTKVPFGDPNVLRESLTRATEDVGHTSKFNISFETVYEQKYIGGVDMTASTYNIIRNLLTMGTSDIRYIGNLNSSILNKLRSANNNSTDISAWIDLIKEVFNSFIGAVNRQLKPSPKSKEVIEAEEKKREEAENEKKDSYSDDDRKRLDSVEKQTSVLNKVLGGSLVKNILASTVGKYVWPLRGSIAMLTGEAATPWHLTIGNPYAPLLSLNNIKVDNITVKLNGDMQYNDIPKYISASIDISQGRNMGKNEILDSLGIQYKRSYNKIK